MIEFHTTNLGQLSEDLDRRKSHIETAMRRAVGSFVALLRATILREVRKAVGLPRSEMNRVRIRGKIVRNKLQASLWIGANPVAVRHLGASVTKKGIKAGGKLYPRAFMPRKKMGGTLILQRTGKERLPVESPEVEIQEIVIAALDREWSHLEAYFDGRVAAELKLIERK